MRHAEPWSPPLEIRLMNLVTRVLLGVVLASLCFVGFVWFITQPKFNVREIEIHNQHQLKHVNVQALQQAVTSGRESNFFTLKLSEVKTVFESVPWVKQATVRRVWPYRLQVSVQEYEPVAFWKQGQTRLQLLDVQGEIFEVNAQDMRGQWLPLLEGPDAPGAAARMWAFYSQVAPDLLLLGWRIDVLQQSDHGIWSMKLSGGAQVVVGRGEMDVLVKRVRDFTQTIQVALKPYGQRPLVRADLRHSGGYAIEVFGVQTNVPVANGVARNSARR